MRIIVTGCGRAGTQYTNKVLTRLGLASAHETVFNYDLDPESVDQVALERRWGTRVLEVSWLAAPFLSRLNPDHSVWHQLRDPLKVVRCWCHKLINTDDGAIRFARKYAGVTEGNSLERAIQYVLGWNSLVERSSLHFVHSIRYRVENVTTELFAEALFKAGYIIDQDALSHILSEVSTSVGTCHHGCYDEVCWGDVLKQASGPALREQAIRYGYEV